MPLFSEHFDFKLPALVNFVGGGGKTSLILRLLEEYGRTDAALYTTTTRIHPPRPVGGLSVISCDDMQLLRLMLKRAAKVDVPGFARIVATRLPIGPNLLGGVPPDFARDLLGSYPVILNEADGARSMSLKVPRPGEPVLMEGADCLVAVIGLDCLYRPAGPETVFRFAARADHYGLHAGDSLTPAAVSSILLHPEGICAEWKPGVRLIVYINKVDTDVDEPPARDLAHAILHSGNFPVERVVLGSAGRCRASSVIAGRQ